MTSDIRSPKILGIYGISDVARYLRVTMPRDKDLAIGSPKLRYWIRTGASSISDPFFPTTKRLVTFQDVISMRMVTVLRAKGIPLPKVRDMETWMRRFFRTEWPFAFRPMWIYQSDVIIEFEKRLIAATRFGQIAMDFIKEWLEEIDLDMTFDSDDIASTWKPRAGIRIDPNIQFGEPCIEGTSIPTRAIWSKVKAGDNLQLIAGLYDVTINQVNDAKDWEARLAEAA